MSQPVPRPLAFLIAAEVTQLQNEHPDVDRAIIQTLYFEYMRRVKSPRLDEARDYVQRVITSLDPDLLRRELRIPEPTDEVKEQPKGDRFSTYEKCGLIIRVIVGEDGKPLFTEADIPALMEKSATVIDRLFDIGARMSGIDVGDGPPSYLQALFPDKLVRALVDRGDSDAEILAAIEGDELKWWFDRAVSSPARCRALLDERLPQSSSGEGQPESGDGDLATERKPTRLSNTPDMGQIAQEAPAQGETVDNATGQPIPVGPAALGEPGGPQARSLYLYANEGVPWNRANLRPVDVAEPALARDMRPGNLPGDLTWPEIEGAFRRLAGEEPALRHRRQRPDEPSRPEVAAALNVSTSTLKRACEAAGEGPQWPPIRFRRR